jgi:hypothetical protein
VSKAGTKRVRRVAMEIAAVGVATTVAGVAATQPASISAPLVDLAALIVVGSSTHPDGSGNEDFFHGVFNATPYNDTGDNLVHVNFFTGPLGIDQALRAHDGETNAVLSSGWGAANASLLLMQMQAQKDPALPQTVFILDNNVARPDGGFGTRYPWFALIGVNPFPSPTDTDALGVVDVGYEYDYNSNAPADVLNPVAAVNSLVAYLYRHLNQNTLDLPVNPDGSPITCGTADTCGITDNGAVLECPAAQCGMVPVGDRVAAYVTLRGKTTYVTYTSNGLPLTNLVRDVVPFGNVIADLTEPVLTEIVNSAYPNGNPIPADPSKYQPATPFSSLTQLAVKVPSAVQQGLTAAAGSGPKTTSTTAITADPEPTGTKKLTTADEDPNPLTSVVRDSEKAVPQSVGSASTPTSHSDPVATVHKPTKGERKKTAHDAPAQSGTTSGDQGASSGTDAEASKS